MDSRKRPIGPNKAERLTIGHGGVINGFTTVITRIPDGHHLWVLFNNTGATNLGAMYEGILDILYGRTPVPAKRPVASLLYETAQKSGLAAALAQYREINN